MLRFEISALSWATKSKLTFLLDLTSRRLPHFSWSQCGVYSKFISWNNSIIIRSLREHWKQIALMCDDISLAKITTKPRFDHAKCKIYHEPIPRAVKMKRIPTWKQNEGIESFSEKISRLGGEFWACDVIAHKAYSVRKHGDSFDFTRKLSIWTLNSSYRIPCNSGKNTAWTFWNVLEKIGENHQKEIYADSFEKGTWSTFAALLDRLFGDCLRHSKFLHRK